MSASLASSTRSRPEPTINVTPLVDVVLVLLIIFMVITPALEQGVQVELPKVTQSDPKVKESDPITLSVDSLGQTYFEKEALSATQIEERLRATAKDGPRKVVIKGDASLRYTHIRELFTAAQRAGFKGISLLVARKPGSEG